MFTGIVPWRKVEIIYLCSFRVRACYSHRYMTSFELASTPDARLSRTRCVLMLIGSRKPQVLVERRSVNLRWDQSRQLREWAATMVRLLILKRNFVNLSHLRKIKDGIMFYRMLS